MGDSQLPYAPLDPAEQVRGVLSLSQCVKVGCETPGARRAATAAKTEAPAPRTASRCSSPPCAIGWNSPLESNGVIRATAGLPWPTGS